MCLRFINFKVTHGQKKADENQKCTRKAGRIIKEIVAHSAYVEHFLIAGHMLE